MCWLVCCRAYSDDTRSIREEVEEEGGSGTISISGTVNINGTISGGGGVNGSTFAQHGGIRDVTMGEHRDDVAISAPLFALFEMGGEGGTFHQVFESVHGTVHGS